MSISSNAANVSIEFLYETLDKGPDIWVKFHNTSMGETISISDNQDEWFDFPASFFSEVTDYLRSKHGLLGAKKASKPSSPVKSFLALPRIVKKPEDAGVTEESPEDTKEEPPLIQIADVRPVESLTALAAGKVKELDIPQRQVIRQADEETASQMRGPPNEAKSIRRTD